jgi:hypothetical protein
MSPDSRKRVIWALAALVVTLAVAGALAAFLSRNDTICPDGKVPVAQRDIGLGQITYQCQNGEFVTPGFAP